MKVAPLRGRGLKHGLTYRYDYHRGRSLTGAWIETALHGVITPHRCVAPLRGRGLKRLLT